MSADFCHMKSISHFNIDGYNVLWLMTIMLWYKNAIFGNTHNNKKFHHFLLNGIFCTIITLSKNSIHTKHHKDKISDFRFHMRPIVSWLYRVSRFGNRYLRTYYVQIADKSFYFLQLDHIKMCFASLHLWLKKKKKSFKNSVIFHEN